MRVAQLYGDMAYHFIKLAFLDAWKSVVPRVHQVQVFTLLETNLNTWARAHDGLTVRVPIVYVEGATAQKQ